MNQFTDKFTATIGVTPGYFHNDENAQTPIKQIGLIWQEKATAVFDLTGCYVGAVITESNTVYHPQWGCPEGGESTFSITGERNPIYFDDPVVYKKAVIDVVTAVADELNQTTTQITFEDVQFVYIDFRNEVEEPAK